MDSSVVSARLIGSLFVEKGLITEEQLEQALEQQRATGERIGEILVEQFGVERLDLASALAEQWAEYERQGQAEEREAAVSAGMAGPDTAEAPPIPAIPTPSVKRPIGEIFVERGLVTDAQLEEALEQQKASGTRLGEILVASGKLSRLELASALADQWATFQKLRPPADSPEPAGGGVDSPSAPDVVLPTPEVVVPAAGSPAPTELAGRIDALAARVDQVAVAKLDWKPQLEKTAELLRARIEYLEEQLQHRRLEGGAEARDLGPELAALAARIDAIPAPSDEWRQELAQVAENLRVRIERVEQGPSVDELAELRSSMTDLAHRLDMLPAPSEEWREQLAALEATVRRLGESHSGNTGGGEELRASLEALAERVESMPAPSDEWRDEIAAVCRQVENAGERHEGALSELRSSMDDLAGRVESLPVPSEEWREQLAELAGRVEALRTDDWRPELAQVAENLGARLERVEGEIADSPLRELDGLRSEVAQLAARLDAMPASSDEVRVQLADFAQTFHARVDQIEQRLATVTHTETLDGVFARLDELATRIDDTTALDDVLHRIAAVAGVAGRVDEVEQRLATESAAAAGFGPVLDELRERAERQSDRVEALARGLSELADRRDAGIVEQELVRRIDSVESTITDVRSTVEKIPSAVEDRIAAVEAGMSALSTPSAGELEALQSELAQITGRIVDADAVGDLRSAVEQHGARIDELRVEQEAFQRHVEEKAAGRSAELSALRARLETVESALSEPGWTDAIGEAYTRVDRLESRLVETMASEAVERNAEVEALRVATSERLGALERNQVKRKDLRELRDAVERVEQRVDERREHDGTATRAVEEAVRDGLAALGERLTAAEASYLNAGRALGRSIEGLGRAITGADAHLTGVDVPPATDRAEHTTFVAFAPTAEGYRLVACDGGAPALGEHVEIPEHDGVLVVTRVGASPLPFDTRPCVYLEHA